MTCMENRLSDTVERKFTDVVQIDDWEVETDSGWQAINSVNKTIPYEEWELHTSNGSHLICADTHIVFDENYNEVFVKDLDVGDLIQTRSGPEIGRASCRERVLVAV